MSKRSDTADLLNDTAGNTDGSSSPTVQRRRRMIALAVILGMVGSVLLGEVIARALGERAFDVRPPDMKVHPAGGLYKVVEDGMYRHASGERNIRFKSGFGWRMTQDEAGLRLTSTNAVDGGEELWLMGCSLTHGWSVNDHETYPWLVQSALPNWRVVNAGVSGYGTVHSRLLYQELMNQRGKPAVVVYAYGRFHDFRNTFVRVWQKGFVPNNRLPDLLVPKVGLDSAGKLEYAMVKPVYQEWPLQRVSALVHALEVRWNRFSAARSDSHAISRELIAQWAAFCLREDIRFVVAGISSDAGNMLDWCRELKIEAVDIAVPLSGTEFTNLPHDNHPNAKAHREYAHRLLKYLKLEELPGDGKSTAQ